MLTSSKNIHLNFIAFNISYDLQVQQNSYPNPKTSVSNLYRYRIRFVWIRIQPKIRILIRIQPIFFTLTEIVRKEFYY